MKNDLEISIKPIKKEQWDDLVRLFGPRGACGGCWCMYWKLSHKEYTANKGDQNKAAQKAIVFKGEIPGLIAYNKEDPVGWIAIESRENYPRMENSRILKPIDDQKVWSIPCFFIDKNFREKGLSTKLIIAAVDYASSKGAKIIEAYPTDSEDKKMPAPFVYTGLAKAFLNAGFQEVERRSPKRPIMRYFIK
jgi:GNAT superfamily N-acetyltransferase